MTSQPSAGGNVRALILKGRQVTGLSQSELAERAQVSRSSIITAEAGTSQPSMEVCLKLAAPLGIPIGDMVLAQARDSVHAVDPEAVAKLETALWTGRGHWKGIADHHSLSIGRGQVLGTVSDSGDLTLNRRFTGCLATRPRRRIVFRDRIVGQRAPSFAVKGSPKGLDYSMHVSVEGEWAQHQVEFRRPWTAEDGPFEFEMETVLPQAFVLDLDEYNRRQNAEGLPQRRDWQGDFRFIVTYAFEQVEITIRFPKSYEPTWREPTATWGNAPIEDYEYYRVDGSTCRGSVFRAGTSEGTLIVDRPLPGFTFGIQWTPVAWEPSVRGEEK